MPAVETEVAMLLHQLFQKQVCCKLQALKTVRVAKRLFPCSNPVWQLAREDLNTQGIMVLRDQTG
jgi:hypothetical protein